MFAILKRATFLAVLFAFSLQPTAADEAKPPVAPAPLADPNRDAVDEALLEALDHPPLITKKFLVPEGTFSVAWMIQKREEFDEEAADDPFLGGEIDPNFKRRPPTIKEHMMGCGVCFPEGAKVWLEADPSPRYDRIVVHNSEQNLALTQSLIEAEVGLHAIVELRLFRQLELVKSLREDPRNLKRLNYTELDVPPLIEFLVKAREEAVGVGEIPGLRGRVDEFIAGDPESPIAIRITSIESALAEELDLLQRRLKTERRRVASLQRELDALSKRQREGDPFAE